LAVRLRGLKGLDKILEKYQDEVTKSPLKKIGEFVINRIQTFTRLGKSIAGSSATSMLPYAESTLKMRKNTKAKTDGEWFRPNAKNAQLVFTGQMLRSLKLFIVSSSKKVTIRPDGNRIDDDKTNLEVAGYVAKTRPFIGLDNAGIQQVTRMIQKEIVKALKKK
jgi:hypothetical protein